MRTRTVISTITLAAAVLAGCSDEPVPKEPDGTASSSPTPTSTETPPPLPEQATENSAEGAAAFLDHYLDVMNYASHTGDVAPLQALSLDTCGSCETFVATVSDVYGKGGRFEGGEWSVAGLVLTPTGSDVSATGDVTLSAGRQWKDDDSDPEETSSETTPLEFRLTFIDDGWKIASYAGAPA